MNEHKTEGFTVIMPTYNQCSYIRKAIGSLLKQTFKKWELIIVNDGCTDETEIFLNDYLSHPKIRYLKNSRNMGLGHALNIGLDHANYGRIACLPSDDFFYENHLQTLHDAFEKEPETILAVSGVKYENPDSLYGFSHYQNRYAVPGHSLQLVQSAHRLTGDRWVERNELVTDDLFAMFWHKLAGQGFFSFTGQITCHWMNHPHQRHKKIREQLGGGVYAYRAYYGVQEPLTIKISAQKLVDEKKQYARFRGKAGGKTKMKILLVGELSFNQERIHSLEKSGCELYGLWIREPYCFTAVGHLPFGHVQDVPYDGWPAAVQKIKPDMIYALLNTAAVPLAHEVLKNKGDIPMVWHFKEGTQICTKQGHWAKLIDLYSHAEGRIYINPEIKIWYETFIKSNSLSFIMDGDMPPGEHFSDCFSPKLSAVDGACHTVIPGRMIGIEAEEMWQLANNNIHVHLYTENFHERREGFIKAMKKVAPSHFHAHPICTPDNWVAEFSRYDAGWLHSFKSENEGDILRATWDDLNMPARMNTLAAAGLPMIQYDNSGHIVAMQEHLKKINGGLFYKNIEDLSAQLTDRRLMAALSDNVLKNRLRFCFDEYVPELMDFFNQVIAKTKKR